MDQYGIAFGSNGDPSRMVVWAQDDTFEARSALCIALAKSPHIVRAHVTQIGGPTKPFEGKIHFFPEGEGEVHSLEITTTDVVVKPNFVSSSSGSKGATSIGHVPK